MNAARTARGFFAAISFSLGLVACSSDPESEPTLCDRLQSCGIVEGSAGLEICTEELTTAGDGARSCEACLDGASCSDVKADACKKPCLGVISAVGGEPPPVSQPGSTKPPHTPPAAVVALCETLEGCQIRPSNTLACAETYEFGLSRELVTLVEIVRCDRCLQLNACDLQTCQLECRHVL